MSMSQTSSMNCYHYVAKLQYPELKPFWIGTLNIFSYERPSEMIAEEKMIKFIKTFLPDGYKVFCVIAGHITLHAENNEELEKHYP